MAIAFLVLAVLGLIATLLALHPPPRPAGLVLWTFLPSLFFGEWAVQLLVAHVVIVAAVAPWASERSAGRVGLGVAAATFVGLVVLAARQLQAWRTRPGLA